MIRHSILAVTALAFAGSVVAGSSIYNGFSANNPDLYPGDQAKEEVTAMPPGVGSDFNRYHGWDARNPDIFGPKPQFKFDPEARPADVYHGFEHGNPDLR